jgi:transcriptional regulator with XRE-family HTH domain
MNTPPPPTAPQYTFRNPFTETFGLRLMAARLTRNKTRATLAFACHVQSQQILYYEQDRNDPRVSTLRTLAENLGVSISFLLGEVPHPWDFRLEIALRYAWASGPKRRCPFVERTQLSLHDIDAVSWDAASVGFPHNELVAAPTTPATAP